jgi:hypothetical protein
MRLKHGTLMLFIIFISLAMFLPMFHPQLMKKKVFKTKMPQNRGVPEGLANP